MTEAWEEYNSNETGAYIRFLLWLGNRFKNEDECKKHDENWRFGKNYPSDEEKHFGYKRKGMEAFF